jgi:tRNA pseudouridine38-40 synthase
MNESQMDENNLKRKLENQENQEIIKKIKPNDEEMKDETKQEIKTLDIVTKPTEINEEKKLREKKKKMVIIIGYIGTNYLGSAYNKVNVEKTIEGVLFNAIYKANCIDPRNDTPQKNKLERCSRTDKGVHALLNVITMKLFDIENLKEKIQQYLPKEIRIHSIQKTTKKFNPKNACDSRKYEYVIPTFVFENLQNIETKKYKNGDIIPPEELEKVSNYNYKLSKEDHEKLNKLMKNFEGTRSYHNFTKRGSKTSKESYKRYITEFSAGETFIIDNIECITITIGGQSFMIHQIR